MEIYIIFIKQINSQLQKIVLINLLGNICINKQQNQSAKIIKINGYSRLNCPNKQILVPSIQNLSQNLDTFEEDFYKSQFIINFQSNNQKNQSTMKKFINQTQFNVLLYVTQMITMIFIKIINQN
ncbi:unnamed protein product [Paramecium sonneborni]|uniref:Transmembrane protein n=1 Tax=Paramecium sonneborni TaxID=65129 RepID=A0A8S1RVY8_9CILI|nr:unnamed protein product [Paramecium sonneborni]